MQLVFQAITEFFVYALTGRGSPSDFFGKPTWSRLFIVLTAVIAGLLLTFAIFILGAAVLGLIRGAIS